MASPANFIVSSLPAYVENNRDLIIKNFALTGPGTRSHIGLQTGIKKDAYLNYLELAPTLQDGSVCDASPAGSVTLSQRTISTAPIQVVLDICAKNLLGKYAEYLVKIGAGEADLPFEEFIVNTLTAEINKRIEKLIWQGDTTRTIDANLKWVNGVLKQLAGDSAKVSVSIASGASAWAAIQAVYAAVPEESLDKGVRIFVSPSLFRQFALELVNKNFYHYPAENREVDEIALPGTGAIVTKAPGLAGTTSIVATFGDNLVYGCDVEDDTERVVVKYDEIADVFKVRVAWNSGIAYKYPDQMVLGTYNGSLVSPDVDGALSMLGKAVVPTGADDAPYAVQTYETQGV